MSTYIPATLKDAHDAIESARKEYYAASTRRLTPTSRRIGVGSQTSSSAMSSEPLSQGTLGSMRISLWSA